MFKMKNLICIIIAIAICCSMTCGAYTFSQFEDVTVYEDWFYNSVEFCYGKGLMKGTTTAEFSPNDNVTRGMFVTMLYRYEGEPAVTPESDFSDITEEDYYYNAVNWAAKNQLVFGINETSFAPDKAISREDMACLIVRYLDFKDIELPYISTCECLFADITNFSEYAFDSAVYMKYTQLMVGDENGYFYPKKSTTRAEVATLFMRLLNNIERPSQITVEIREIPVTTELLTTDETTDLINILGQIKFHPKMYAEVMYNYAIVVDGCKYGFCYTSQGLLINYQMVYGQEIGGSFPVYITGELKEKIDNILLKY